MRPPVEITTFTDSRGKLRWRAHLGSTMVAVGVGDYATRKSLRRALDRLFTRWRFCPTPVRTPRWVELSPFDVMPARNRKRDRSRTRSP